MSNIIGNKLTFAIEYSFFDNSKLTEIGIYHKCKNILAYEKNGIELSTRWNLDELVLWLNDFVKNLSEDKYPVATAKGQFAAQKDDDARIFDSDDDDEFEAYYNKLYQWSLKHRWRTVSTGEIIADVYFQLVGNQVEISWNNRGLEPDVRYQSVEGGFFVEKDTFVSVVNEFIALYQKHWM